MKVKILFDKRAADDKYYSGWGQSYLIDGKVLFDLGESQEHVIKNIQELGVDLSAIEKIVISHKHWNHRAGLGQVLENNKNAELYVCSDLYQEIKDKGSSHKVSVVKDSQEICKNIYTSGCFEVLYKGKSLLEQALFIRTEKGISIVCGCAHPGILEYLKKAREMFPQEKIYLIFGGFHLIDKDKRYIDYIAEELKSLGVVNIGPSHCTGFKASSLLKGYFPKNFIKIESGLEIDI